MADKNEETRVSEAVMPETAFDERQSISEQDIALRHQQHDVQTMLRNGWCSHQVHYLAQKYDRDTFRDLAQMKLSPERRRDHTPCLSQPSCIAYNVDMINYRTVHRTGGCNCSHLQVPYDALTNMIGRGQIPLISIEYSKDSNRPMELRLHRRTVVSKYTAISHVWADGLGNPAENALPACQLQHLAARFEDLHGSPERLFWFDTLCIPVKDEHASLRNRSIDNMASIYAGAELVLVLDRELMQINSGTFHDCLARIICSVWMCRSWTLQEGILANQCGFALSGRTVVAQVSDAEEQLEWRRVDHPFERKWHHHYNGFPRDTWRTEYLNHVPFKLKDFFGLRLSYLPQSSRFTHVWNALAGRSTSKSEDLLLILANLLGLSTQKFQSLAPEKRLPAIIFSLEAIPFSLLFNSNPHISQGFSKRCPWAPTELDRSLLDLHPLMHVSKSSMRLESSSFWDNYSCYYVAKQDVSPGNRTITFQPSGNQATFSFPSTEEPAAEKDGRHYEGICFVVRRRHVQMSPQSAGDKVLIFYSNRWDATRKNRNLILSYHASADLIPRTTTQSATSQKAPRPAGPSPQLVDQDTEVFIEHDSKLNLPQLKKGRDIGDYKRQFHWILHNFLFLSICFVVWCAVFFVALFGPSRTKTNPTLFPLLWFISTPLYYLILVGVRRTLKVLAKQVTKWRRVRRYKLEREGA
ncbi:hypothetical protein BKA63DRAFT_166234 [Paraphoma chrysanthemicola]|nr:hypothetical protein BKA63DRAFT_166234 [Paraphoma chrysanthemicola]